MADWTALLEGPERERALESVREVAEALRTRQEREGVTLADGLAGRAFLFAELERQQPGNGHREHARELLLKAAAAIEEYPLPPSLYGGFSGIAWAIERIAALGIPSVEDLDEIDEALADMVSRKPWNSHYDLIVGLVGIGVYALERLPRPAAARCLEELVARLEERAVRSGPGLAWWTPASLLPEHQRAEYPDGYFNLGAAHGVPAAVALLALIARAGVAEQRARALAEGAARWMLANVLPHSPGARFPTCVAPGIPIQPHRSAWCYGDPGVVLCLLVAARALADAELEHRVLELAREAARRPAEHAGVKDAGLCHGAAGLGHVYNRLYQATREPLFQEAATAWFVRTLDLRRPGEGVGGYFAWSAPPGEEHDMRWMPDGSLLTGSAGIALALLAACHSTPPSWDGMLMAALPA